MFGGHLIATALDEPDEMALTTGAIDAITGPQRRVLVADQVAPAPDAVPPDDAFRPPVPPRPPAPDDEDRPPPPPEA